LTTFYLFGLLWLTAHLDFLDFSGFVKQLIMEFLLGLPGPIASLYLYSNSGTVGSFDQRNCNYLAFTRSPTPDFIMPSSLL